MPSLSKCQLIIFEVLYGVNCQKSFTSFINKFSVCFFLQETKSSHLCLIMTECYNKYENPLLNLVLNHTTTT